MADIVVDTYKLNRYAQRISSVNRRIARLDSRLDSLYYSVGLQGLYDLLKADLLTSYSWRLIRAQSYLENVAADIKEVEKTLQNQDPLNFNPHYMPVWFDIIDSKSEYWDPDKRKILKEIREGLWPHMIGYGVAESALTLLSSDGWKSFWAGDLSLTKEGAVWSKASEDGEDFIKILSGNHTTSVTPDYGKYKDKKLLGDEDHLNVNVDQKKIRDESKQKNPDEKWYKEKGTILEGKTEDKIEGSVVQGRVAGSNDWAEGSVEGKFLTGEAHAEASAGLYVYTKDKDGNTQKIFSPGVSAEVGASVSVLDVEAEGRIGLGEDKNMLGVYGDVGAEALTAEAKGKVALNRKEIYAGASAEADLVKVTGTAGVSVLGTDVGVTGSLKVGVGVHAEAGYTDGKLKVDIGAAVGVGFDLGFEVDVSGTVDAVCDVASNTWENISNTWDKTADKVSTVWQKIF